VKPSKAQIYTKCHKIPEIRFEDQQLTSFSGVIIFQLLFGRLNLKAKLKKMFFTLKSITDFWAPPDRHAAHHSFYS